MARKSERAARTTTKPFFSRRGGARDARRAPGNRSSGDAPKKGSMTGRLAEKKNHERGRRVGKMNGGEVEGTESSGGEAAAAYHLKV